MRDQWKLEWLNNARRSNGNWEIWLNNAWSIEIRMTEQCEMNEIRMTQ